jgi:hypothetical protein
MLCKYRRARKAGGLSRMPEGAASASGRKRFFFKKKKQKTFAPFGPGTLQHPG